MCPRSSVNVGAFFAAVPLSSRWQWRRVRVGADGQLAFGAYLVDAAGRGRARAIEVLGVDANARISDITSFHTPETFTRFGLPIEPVP